MLVELCDLKINHGPISRSELANSDVSLEASLAESRPLPALQ